MNIDGGSGAALGAAVAAVIIKLIDRFAKPVRRLSRDDYLLSLQRDLDKRQSAFESRLEGQLRQCESRSAELEAEVQSLRIQVWTLQQAHRGSESVTGLPDGTPDPTSEPPFS